MNNTILICMIPITAIVVGIIVLKAVQLGLRWQLQAAAKQEPTMSNPIIEAVQAKKDEKARDEAKTFIEEVLYGERSKM